LSNALKARLTNEICNLPAALGLGAAFSFLNFERSGTTEQRIGAPRKTLARY
jgi:hypothetical protein